MAVLERDFTVPIQEGDRPSYSSPPKRDNGVERLVVLTLFERTDEGRWVSLANLVAVYSDAITFFPPMVGDGWILTEEVMDAYPKGSGYFTRHETVDPG